MDVDFPLILTWAVVVCAVVWGFDVVALRPRRQRAVHVLASRGGTPDAAAVAVLEREPRVVEYARSFFPVLLLVLVLRSFLVEPYQIPSESMVPTLEVGDFILVNKYAYGIRLPVIGTKIFDIGTPRRGDVMVFIPPHESRYFIKRVIGVSGDRVKYQDQSLTINGERVPVEFVDEVTMDGRPYLRIYDETLGGHLHKIYRYPGRIERPQEWVVPEGHYFMMGDNRGRSDDSRHWGFVPDHNVVGKAFAVWVHKEPGFHWPTFSRNGGIE